ncbi:hypothetical protein JRO89_XS03G0182100 [Xanthoceras sorbifolium]|uniref:DRBM domain-containing protein n=1 Tax=Xanthoceras sorbifolium TaxID=99658 RepID=A0ABQ8IAP7_9ROSI|nr:hypothetical protein JRO89_XS03G0182100 [Xanthoceras sorbifolium]
MYKNQLQELAQRSCFNLPSYSCIREGPDHAPRFKAAVNFNGEIFGSPTFCSTLRQAEHAAAEVALNVLSNKGPSKALAARVLDETGVYKNLLQETVHRAGLKLPVYTTIRSGPGHVPVFSCTVELGGMSFTGEPAKTKKQAQKNAALTAWSALKNMSKSASSSSSFSPSPLSESGGNDEQEQVIIARYLATLKPPETNKTLQRERQLGQGSAPMGRDVISYSGGRSLYTLQHQNSPMSQFSPELSVYQTYSEARASEQWGRFLALSSLPTSPPRPQFFPIIRSIFQPDHGHYFLAQGQEPVPRVPEIGPFLCFSNHVMPVPVRSVSQVTIQEIDEHLQIDDKWPQSNRDSDSWNINSPSNVPRRSPSEVPNSLVSLNSHSQQRMQEMLQEIDKEESVGSAPTRNTIQFHGNQIEQGKFMNARFRPRAISTEGPRFRLQSPHGLDYMQPNIRPVNPPMASSSGSARGFTPASFAAPVTMRTSNAVSTSSLRPESSNPRSSNPRMRAAPPTRIPASACSSRPWPERRKNLGGTRSVNYMAPAVHIRSVVPVCSAPPAKRPPGPSLEGLFSGAEKKLEEPEPDIAALSSNLNKLQI